MNVEELRESPIGDLVPISGQDENLNEYSHYAFVPHPLPDTVELQTATWTRVAEATAALGRLHQACVTLPNPSLLIRPALAREAVDTSALEGTYGALADVLEARVSDSRNSSPEVNEIRAYERIALEAFGWVEERPVTIGLLENLQGTLAADSHQPQRDPGKIREHQVVIGPKGSTVYEARYIPPPPDDRLKAGLEQWQVWIEEDHDLPAPVRAAMAHYQFESLHPFGDGNGRLGRLIIVLQLVRSGLIAAPSLTISPWLRKRRDAYQRHLYEVSRTGDWNPWIQFFCEAICEQSKAAVDAVEHLNRWSTEVRATMAEKHWSGTVISLFENLIDWPVITSAFVQETYDVSAPTAKSAIDRLVEIGVLRDLTGGAYRRVYGAVEVMKTVDAL